MVRNNFKRKSFSCGERKVFSSFSKELVGVALSAGRTPSSYMQNLSGLSGRWHICLVPCSMGPVLPWGREAADAARVLESLGANGFEDVGLWVRLQFRQVLSSSFKSSKVPHLVIF